MEVALFILTAICATTGIICASPIVAAWWRDRAQATPMNRPRSAWRSWAALGLSAFAFVFSGIGLYRVTGNKIPDYAHFAIEKPAEKVYAKTFVNQTVEADGKIFDRCTFENVTFMYHGLAEWGFTEDTFKGNIIVDTDNVSLKSFAVVMNWMGHRPGIAAFGVGVDDGNGNVQVLSWDAIPVPKEKH